MRQMETLEGVREYLAQTASLPPRPAPAAATVWQQANARLWHYPPRGKLPSAPPVLLIPSLINRYYILDLDEKRSLARFLSQQGMEVYLLDWRDPGELEMTFGLSDYMEKLLIPAIAYIHAREEKPPALIGYCMGGLLALAAAQLAPQHVAAIALLATPWDFHSVDTPVLRLRKDSLDQARRLLEGVKTLSGEAILHLFHMSDPWRFQEKFRNFHRLKQAKARDYFIAVEQWANDCVPLAHKVAAECLLGWQQNNTTFKEEWRVMGETIRPTEVRTPVFFAAAQHDRIVPLQSAMALARHLPGSTVIQPKSGHIGMVTGTHRQQQLWQPLRDWLLH